MVIFQPALIEAMIASFFTMGEGEGGWLIWRGRQAGWQKGKNTFCFSSTRTTLLSLPRRPFLFLGRERKSLAVKRKILRRVKCMAWIKWGKRRAGKEEDGRRERWRYDSFLFSFALFFLWKRWRWVAWLAGCLTFLTLIRTRSGFNSSWRPPFFS